MSETINDSRSDFRLVVVGINSFVSFIEKLSHLQS